jgi:uncharacterized protein YdbL (DUF1318 family)
MAVRIPIVTVFDSKGLKQAQYQLNKVRGNFQNLGRNFALAGAAFAGAAAVIAKSAQDLARIEKINAQTEAVLKSMGNSAGVTAQHIQDLAGNLERLTASEAETIQEGANLLLTFRNIQNQVGANNDIFDQAVTMSVDLARAMGTEASGEAIRLGKALNDPTKGVAALTRVGVSFTEQQKEQIKALQESGDLLGAQKIILGELQAQFGGSGQAYAATFAGQVELLNHELGALGEEATMVVMPALQTMVASLRELAPEVGAKLSAAIGSVDWKAFTEGIVDAITFLVENAETIMRVVTAMFLLNTAYNAGRVAVGLYNAAIAFLNTTMKSTTGVANGLRTALFLGGVTLAVGYVIDSYRKLKTAIQNTNTSLSAFDTEVLSVTKAAGEINPIVKLWNNLTNAILNALTAKKRFDGGGAAPKPTIGTGFGGADVNSWRDALPPVMEDPFEDLFKQTGGAGAKKKTPLADLLKQLKIDGKKVQLEAKLIGAGISDGLAKQLSSTLPIKKIEGILKKIVDTGGKYAKKLQKLWGMTAAGIAEVAGSATTTDAAVVAKEQNLSIIDSIKELVSIFKAPKRELGAFQQAVVDTFESINEAIKKRDFGGRQTVRYLGVAAFVQQQLEAIAKQRDEIAGRIEKSKSFMSAVIDSIIAPTDITKLGKTSTAIIGSLKKTITQTMNFRKQISDLGGMGLSSNAIQQIVQAGAIEGGQTASALLAGGPEAINEVNSLYAQLGSTAETFAETAGQVIYGAGVDVSNGLIAGLLSQDAALRQAATTLGNSFSNYFKKRLGISLRPETMDITAAGTTRAGTVVNLTVTAPYGSRPQDFGRMIVEAINDFERSSGRVFARA